MKTIEEIKSDLRKPERMMQPIEAPKTNHLKSLKLIILGALLCRRRSARKDSSCVVALSCGAGGTT